MGFKLDTSGGFPKTEAWIKKMQSGDIYSTLDKYGAMGVAALAAATPVESGETAAAWAYEIVRRNGYYSIRWYNTHTVDGKTSVAILLQIGHGTGTGGYVQGQDYINPAIQPIFDQIDAEVRKVVSTNA